MREEVSLREWSNKWEGREKSRKNIYIKRFSISLCIVLSLELYYSSMLKLLAFRTFEVRDFLVFIMPKNLALISTLCQIYVLYNKCDILTFKRNHFTFFFKRKKNVAHVCGILPLGHF